MKRIGRWVYFVILITILSGCNFPSGIISGKVTGSITGLVKDPQGVFLSGVEIAVGDVTTLTNASGIFTIKDLEVGNHVLVAKQEGYISRNINISVASGSNVIEDIILQPANTGYQLIVTIEGSGKVTKTPEQQSYSSGATVTLQATPTAGWDFQYWQDGQNIVDNPYVVTIDKDRQIKAVFAENQQEQYNLSVYIEGGTGSVDITPKLDKYPAGTEVTLTAKPSEGYRFIEWTGDISGVTNPVKIVMDGNRTVTAKLSELYVLSTSIAGTGSISKVPNQEYYLPGSVVQVTANPANGWSFDHWEGDVVGTNSTVNITMDRDKNISAIFKSNQYSISISVYGNGNVSVSPDYPSYTHGTAVQLLATPDEGWVFSHWENGLTGSSNPAPLTVTGNLSITAVFIPTYTVNITITGQGSVSKSPNQEYYGTGSIVTLTAVPATGWKFDHWEGDSTGNTNPLSISVTKNTSVTAVFTEVQYTLSLTINGTGNVMKFPDKPYYLYGEQVQLTAVPAQGKIFSRWEGSVTGSTNPVTLTMDNFKTVTAVFANSIQGAIAGASSGDTIIVPPGTYYENIDFQGKAIILRSVNPDDSDVVSSTIIDGQNARATVSFISGENNGSVLTGFTIINGYSDQHGGGIRIINSSPTITKNIIRNNSAKLYGGGIYIASAASLVLEDNIIKDNSAYAGGAVYIASGSCGPIRRNTFIGNGGLGALYRYWGDLELTNNIFKYSKNGALFLFGGVFDVRGNVFEDNTANQGGAITFSSGSIADVVGNNFTDNFAYDNGGAIYLTNNAVLRNEYENVYVNNVPNNIYINK